MRVTFKCASTSIMSRMVSKAAPEPGSRRAWRKSVIPPPVRTISTFLNRNKLLAADGRWTTCSPVTFVPRGHERNNSGHVWSSTPDEASLCILWASSSSRPCRGTYLLVGDRQSHAAVVLRTTGALRQSTLHQRADVHSKTTFSDKSHAFGLVANFHFGQFLWRVQAT